MTSYSGKWSDQSIKGKIESDWAGEKQTFDWEAESRLVESVAVIDWVPAVLSVAVKVNVPSAAAMKV